MAEADHYEAILVALSFSLSRAFQGGSHLEVTATKGLTDPIKKAIPVEREIAFSFLTDRPDIAGVLETQFAKHLLVAEVKEESPTLADIYQVKRYKEVLGARYAFLFTIGQIQERLKRLCNRAPAILRSFGDDGYSFLVIAQFFPGTREFIDWYPGDPFQTRSYWE
jgi:hypothetical protein